MAMLLVASVTLIFIRCCAVTCIRSRPSIPDTHTLFQVTLHLQMSIRTSVSLTVPTKEIKSVETSCFMLHVRGTVVPETTELEHRHVLFPRKQQKYVTKHPSFFRGKIAICIFIEVLHWLLGWHLMLDQTKLRLQKSRERFLWKCSCCVFHKQELHVSPENLSKRPFILGVFWKVDSMLIQDTFSNSPSFV